MDSSKIKAIMIVVVAAIAAIYLGVAAATAQFEAIAWVGGGLFVTLLLALGRHVWALVPVMGVLEGFVNALPGSPSAWYLGVFAAIGVLVTRFTLRSRDFYWRFTWTDALIALQIPVLAQAYLRNPTGFALFGGDIVGGKPYVEYAIAIMGYFCLAFIRTDYQTVTRVIKIMILVMAADSLLKALSGFSPGLALAVGRLYSNVDYAAASSLLEGGSDFDMTVDTRFGSLRDFADFLGLLCMAFYRPITCLLPIYPKQFILFSISLVAMLFSGFRSGLLKLGMYFTAACIVRRKPLDLFWAGIFAFLILSGLLATGELKRMPFSIQRVLSFLPIEVDSAARAEAQGSSDWRFEMWKLALTTDRYISNKILGDGFGFSADEQKAQFDVQARGGYLTKQQNQDLFLTKGSYHGFHVETIRFTGVLGLIIATIILLIFMNLAYRNIRYFEGRHNAKLIMFVCLPFLISPIYYWLVFGSYKSGFVTYILASGILKVLDNVHAQEIASAKSEAAAAQATTKPLSGLTRGRLPISEI